MRDRKHLEQAIEQLLPIVARLSASEWKHIVSVIDHAYSIKAAKVTLDGTDMEKLNSSLRCEILGEPFITAQKQSE